VTGRCAWILTAVAACGGGGGDQPDARAVDAPPAIDSRLAACTGEHVERIDRENDPVLGGTPEPTGLELVGGATIAICGELAGGDLPDADFFALAIGGDDSLATRVELRAATADGPISLNFWRVRESGALVLTAAGRVRGGLAVLAPGALPPDTYAVSVSAGENSADPIPYAISILERASDCVPGGSPAWEESTDGGGARGNDTIAASFSPAAAFALTAASEDAPEPTAITVDPGQTAVVRGESAAIGSDGDAYRDRDAFEIATGRDANEIELRLSWPHADGAPDLDLFAFPAGEIGDELTGGFASLSDVGADEAITLAIEPSASYWIWVGAFADSEGNLPVEYDVTVCARELLP
jgi:hypothetical protein